MCSSHIRAIFVWPWNVVSVSVRYLFISQWMNRSKHGLLVFLPKKTVIWRKHKFDWAIMLQNNVKATCWFISWKVFGHEVFWVERSLSGAFAPFVSIWQTNQSTLFPFICCFCFVCAFSFLRSYENRSIRATGEGFWTFSHCDQTYTESV